MSSLRLDSDYTMQPLWSVVTLNDEVLPESTPDEFELQYADISSVSFEKGIENAELLKFSDAPSRARRVARDGDVIVSTVRTYLKAIAEVRRPPANFIVSTGFAVLRPRPGLSPRFLAYLAKSDEFCAEVESRSVGVSYPAVSPQEVAKIKVPVPPRLVQDQIAEFLDRETAEIDALIEKQERLIALLEEKRQAAISHAVTKGLDPNAPMKDSGIPWIGQVPAHWQIASFRRFVSVLPGYAFPSTGFSYDGTGIRLLRGINVGVGAIRWDDEVRWIRSGEDGLGRFELAPFDIVMGMDRPWVSEGIRVARLSSDDLPAMLLQRVAKIECLPSVCPDFVFALLRSNAFGSYFEPETTGVSVPHISGEQILAFRFACPPVSEQKEITEEIQRLSNELTKIADKARGTINVLHERRSSLISAAVTGKIDIAGRI